ncbi:MAG: putative autotransporter protein [Acidobacteriaceae bacterium]|nr:putative autotransporter protein [Acidobacteriaceae bacterium]
MKKILCSESRPAGRLFCCLISVLVVALNLHASGPTMTTISDVVYRANGQPATGTVVITWPAFTTSDNKAVAAGELSTAIGPSGVLTLSLAPNESATPSGTYYKVVYKLSDGMTSTEYWVVPLASPTTIGAIRASVVPTQVAAQLASRQYVDNAVSGNTDAVVHKTGTESITGVKTFSVSPIAPTPTSGTAIANKAYVDAAVSGVTGSFVRTTGDTMTGQLTLANDPVAPGQAANRHYVDIQTSTLNAGLLSKLGRINDSPITLAGVRYADQFAGTSVGGQIDAACADLAGANGTVVIPNTLGPGWSLQQTPSNCNIRDERGNGGSTQASFARGTDFYTRVTTTTGGFQIPSTLLLEQDAFGGGVNSYPGGAGTKTQWGPLRIEMQGRTIGERKGIEANIYTSGKGDSIGGMFSSFDFGGYNTGGDEGSEGLRAVSFQGLGNGTVPVGTVSAITGTTITGTWTSGTNAYLGEQRPLINSSRGVYSTGTLASGSGTAPFTIVGSGTAWAATLGAGAKSDLFLEYTAFNGGARFVIPVLSIVDDTHLTAEYSISEIGPTGFSPSGAYKIFRGGMVSSLASPPSGSLNATAVNLAAGGGDFQVGDSIEQPLGYNYHGRGLQIALNQVLGGPTQGGGIAIDNVGTQNYRDAIRVSGAVGSFVNGLNFFNQVGQGVVFNSSPNGLGDIVDFGTSNVATSALYFLHTNGASRRLILDRTVDTWFFGGGQALAGGDSRFALGGIAPDATTQAYIYLNNAAWRGLIVNNRVAPNAGVALADFQVNDVPLFRIENTKVKFNNSVDVLGYSDNATTQKWGVTGSTGAGRFDGGIVGSTLNATSGFQVNSVALNFSHLAGSVSAAQMPALGGDATSAAGGTTTTVSKVNGVSYPVPPATDTTPIVTSANTVTYKPLSNCTDTAGNHLNYDTSAHAFSCGTSSSGAAFTAVSTGVNTTATMTVGTGAVLTTSGSGVNNANQFKGNSTIGGADGGTGQTTYTKGDLLTSAGGSTLVKLAAGSYSQHLIADPSAPNGIKWGNNEAKPNFKIARSFFACGTATACAANDSVNTSVGLTGTGAVPGTAYPVALTLTATTTVNNVANMDGRSLYRTGRNHLFEADAYFPATTDYAATRAFVGLTDQSAATMVGSDAPVGNYAGFIFSTTAGTANWYCIQGNGSTSTAVSSGVAGNSTTNHKFEFAFDDTAVNVTYRIDGNIVCTNPTTATLPSANINMKMETAIQNLTAGTTRAIAFGWLFDLGDL